MNQFMSGVSARAAWKWTALILGAVAFWVIVRKALVEGVQISTNSMANTLLAGDFLFVNKTSYGVSLPLIGRVAAREARRADIVVFNSVSDNEIKVVKRVIGIPGDTVSMSDGILAVNNETIREVYLDPKAPVRDTATASMRAWQTRHLLRVDPRNYHPTLRTWGPIVVPEDSFLVLGDNRSYSVDSRHWGLVGRDRIRGRVALIYYSYARDSVVTAPYITAVRVSRMFSTPR